MILEYIDLDKTTIFKKPTKKEIDEIKEINFTDVVLPKIDAAIKSKDAKNSYFSNFKNLEICCIEKATNIPDFYFISCTTKKYIFKSPIKSIGYGAFALNKNLENIEIPSSVVEMAPITFQNCTSLKSAKIDANVSALPIACFSGCEKLESVTLSGDIKSILREAFSNCISLKEVTLSKNLKIISGNAFEGCTSLEKIDLPESVEIIMGAAFRNCKNLKEITLPKNLRGLTNTAFSGCKNLTINCTATQANMFKKQLQNRELNIIYSIDELLESGKSLKEINTCITTQEEEK